MDFDEKLSRTISHALRHAPDDYGLTLDSQGWVCVNQLIAALALRHSDWSALTQGEIVRLNQQSDKQRFEIHNGMIRASYGHSLSGQIDLPAVKPPPVLYHGTKARSLEKIQKAGLLPMKRQFVHLSVTRELALRVAERRQGPSIIIRVYAQDAAASGINFYLTGDNIWLSEPVPSEFLQIEADVV